MSRESFRSPFAALVWKEWRESWWLLALMAIGPAAWTIAPRVWPDPDRIAFADLLAALAVSGVALSLGAVLFASERASGTQTFQHERPVGRGTIWNAKLLMPILALASGAVLLIAACLLWPPETWRKQGPMEPVIMLIAWFLSFTSAVLCSVLLDRPLTAGAAGAVLCITAVAGQSLLIERLIGWNGPSENWCWPVFLGLLIVEAIGLLWLSRVAYVRWMHD
jgi:hypothetical protein